MRLDEYEILPRADIRDLIITVVMVALVLLSLFY